MIEVLIPDFQGHMGHLLKIVDAAPEVIAHNVEVPERLTASIRDPRAGYQQSLDVLAAIKRMDPARFTKSSIMVGLGESPDEVRQTMRDLRAVDCDFLTIGQYLQPTPKHAKVHAFNPPRRLRRLPRRGGGDGVPLCGERAARALQATRPASSSFATLSNAIERARSCRGMKATTVDRRLDSSAPGGWYRHEPPILVVSLIMARQGACSCP